MNRHLTAVQINNRVGEGLTPPYKRGSHTFFIDSYQSRNEYSPYETNYNIVLGTTLFLTVPDLSLHTSRRGIGLFVQVVVTYYQISVRHNQVLSLSDTSLLHCHGSPR